MLPRQGQRGSGEARSATARPSRPGGISRGVLLLEVVLAMTIFVSAGIAILSLVGQAGDDLLALRDRVRAADLARSAMAKLEAGIADPLTLSGPVRAWEEEEGASGGFDSSPPREIGWELKIETEPSEFMGLTRVSVTASRGTAGQGGASAPVPVSFTLHQLVRLSGKAEETAGVKHDLPDRARSAAPSSPLGRTAPKPATPAGAGNPRAGP